MGKTRYSLKQHVIEHETYLWNRLEDFEESLEDYQKWTDEGDDYKKLIEITKKNIIRIKAEWNTIFGLLNNFYGCGKW